MQTIIVRKRIKMEDNIKTAEPDIYKKSRVYYIIEAAVEYFLAMLVGTTYLAKMTTAIGISDGLTGVITAFVSLGFGFQIFALLIAHKKPIKTFVIIMNLLTQLAFTFLYAVPLFDLSTNAKTAIFIALFLFGEIIKNVIYSPKMAWTMGIVDDSKRGSFTAKKEIISLVSGMIISTSMGRLIDYFEANGNLKGAFITCGLTMLALTLIHTLLLVLIKEKPEKIEKASVKLQLKSAVTDKNLLLLIPLFVFWNIATYATTPFYGTYQLNDLEMSMTLVTIVAAVGALSRAAVSAPIGKFADKYSFVAALNICFSAIIAAYFINIFAGVGFYTAYVILHSIGMAGINSSLVNLVYDYVPHERRTGALAIKNTVAGFAGFFTTLAVRPLVDSIQKNGNRFLFIYGVYAQQILSAFGLIMTVTVLIYLNLVVKKLKKCV